MDLERKFIKVSPLRALNFTQDLLPLKIVFQGLTRSDTLYLYQVTLLVRKEAFRLVCGVTEPGPLGGTLPPDGRACARDRAGGSVQPPPNGKARRRKSGASRTFRTVPSRSRVALESTSSSYVWFTLHFIGLATNLLDNRNP